MDSKIKRTAEEADGTDSSDDEFVTRSMAHMTTKKLQNIRLSKGKGAS